MEKQIIRNTDLMNVKFDIETLEFNIDRLSLRALVGTQKLTADFCAKYILYSDEHASCVEDTYIGTDEILAHQTHITREELMAALDKLYKSSVYYGEFC